MYFLLKDGVRRMKLRTDRYSHVKSVLSTGSVQILSVKEQCVVLSLRGIYVQLLACCIS